MDKQAVLTINQRQYPWPDRPIVVICIDGNSPEYFVQAIKAGKMPYVASLMTQPNQAFTSHCVLPAFTNPNNMSIITGQPPAIHGICGNYYYDKGQQKDIMMNDPSLLMVPTIIQEFHRAGARVAAITAKDKLRTMLSHGIDCSGGKAFCFSAEKANQTTVKDNGIERADLFTDMPTPDVYSAKLSEFVFKAGVRLLEQQRPDLMYLTTTDYVQHAHGPEEAQAIEFYAMMDSYFAKLDALGATIVITADHGMNAKYDAKGQPDVVYLDEVLAGKFPHNYHTILPITDPYVAHHGALGSFAGIYVEDDALKEQIKQELLTHPKIIEVIDKLEACRRFQLHPERIADLIVISDTHVVLGKTKADHDLSQLHNKLRSHGGISEQEIPMVVNFQLPQGQNTRQLHNYDAFYLAANRRN